MHNQKIKNLEKKGWKLGSAIDFLDLTAEEAAYVDMKIKLSADLKRIRKAQKLTQIDLAKILKSSQSRVAKLERGDPSVSIDLLIRSLIALGATNKEISRSISS